MTFSTADVLPILSGVRGNGPWTALCPAHDDERRSLSVNDADGRALWKCHAGCSQAAVTAAIRAKLGGSENNGDSRKLVATYTYTDESGRPVFYRDRFEWFEKGQTQKGVYPRQLDGTRTGVPGVPYRLHEVRHAVATDGTIIFAEGEKAVDVLRAHEYTATTTGGATSWHRMHAEHFRGARAVLWPDADAPGERFIAAVARDLVEVGAEIRVLRFQGKSSGWDAADFFAEGGTEDQLDHLLEDAPAWMPPVIGQAMSSPNDYAGAPVLADRTSEVDVYDDEELGQAWITRVKPQLADVALAGPIGEAVAICAPECEASPISILLPALTIYGCMVGRRVVQDIGGSHHFLNLFGMLVGETGEGRKGTGNSVAHRIMSLVDPRFMTENVASGLSSGEGVIGRLADSKIAAGEIPRIRDSRLHIAEEEAGTAFTRMKRDGNSLSGVMRQAWDGRPLSTLTRKDEGGLIAKEPLVSVIMQVTPDELRTGLGDIELVNGFMNRFVLAWTERVRMLPFGRPVDPDSLRRPVAHLQQSLSKLPAEGKLELDWAPDARDLYASAIYPSLRPLPGRLAAMTARGAPIIRRLAGIYCIARGAVALSVEDLAAAVAIWNYSIASARYIYGGVVFSPLAQQLLDALEAAGDAGLGLTGLRDAVGGQKIKKPSWDSALRELQLSRQVLAEREKTSGRTRTTLRLVRGGKDGEKSCFGAY